MDELQELLDRIGSEDPNVTPPTAEELTSAQSALKAELKREGSQPNADLEVLQTLKAAYDQVTAALADAEAREAETRAAVDELLADILTDEDKAEGADAPPAEPADNADTEEKEPVLAGGAVRMLSLSDAAARMRERPAPPAPPVPSSQFRTLVQGREYTGAPLTLEDVRSTFAEFTRNPRTDGKHTLIRHERIAGDGWTVLSDDVGKRSSQVDAIVSPEAVAAAGGCCILPEPIRDQTVNASTARPIQDSLPSFGVQTTGAVTFYPPVCMPQEGAFIWTCDDDAAVDPDDPETWKQCVEFDCDEAVVTTVDAIYHCITIGNFQRFFDGQRWRAVLQTLLATEARLAETHLYAKMRAQVTSTHVLGDTGSVFVSFIQGLGLAGEIMRQDQRLADVNLRLWAPAWLRQAMRDDLVARRIVHIDDPVATDRLIDTATGNAGANVTWSLDLDVIDPNPVTSGPLADYPGIAHLVLAPEGYYTRLDPGSFDLGTEIRDFNLTRQNAVAAFAEEFQGLMARGCAAFALDLPVSVCQVADGCEPLS